MMKEPTSGYERVRRSALAFVEAMKLGDHPATYQKEAGGGESFYGSYHALHIRSMFGRMDGYTDADLDRWAAYFNQRQTPHGFYASQPERVGGGALSIEALEPYWHYTRGNLWSMRLLGRKPEHPFTFLEPLMETGALYRWVKHYDWSNSWAAGNQVLACATALMGARDWFGWSEVDRVMEEGMYPALEELLDEETGFWGTQFGADRDNGLFGTIHVVPVYYAQGWPVRGLERCVDSTLLCQLADGSFWPHGSDCPDYDGAYMMANLAEQTDYRREDLERAARAYLDHALMHESPDGVGWLIHRRDSRPEQWVSRPHWIWKADEKAPTAEYRDEDPSRDRIMLGSWFYPLSIALAAHMLGDTGYEGPYSLTPMSLHECNVFTLSSDQPARPFEPAEK